jgi:acyl-CoA synthetase (AMP-forming)/AMP-acid ligase II
MAAGGIPVDAGAGTPQGTVTRQSILDLRSNRMPQDPILERFGRVVRQRPTEPLAISPTRTISASAVQALAGAVAARLAGLDPGELVGLATPNGPAFLVAFLALRQAGLTVLLLDAAAPAEGRRSAAVALGAVACLECAIGWPESPDSFTLTRLKPAEGVRCPAGAALVKLTSGTTGSPRGVLTSADQALADEEALVRSMGLRDGDRIVAAVPMSHSYGFSSVTLSALVRGFPLAIPEGGHPLAPLEAARAADATFFPTVPAFLQALLKLSRPPEWPSSLRLVITAGAALPPEVARAFGDTYRMPVHVFYGSSECGGICYDREGTGGERGTVGTPVEGVSVSLEPWEAESVVTVRSASVAMGYLPEPDPRLADGRFFSSDRGEWVLGELRLTGRVDGLINVKGKKVDPAEVERILSGLLGVEEVVVLGVPSPSGGQLVRAVVGCPTGKLDAVQVVAFCRGHLADHKVPRSVILVPSLPRNSRGKLDRPALLALRSENAADPRRV